MKKKQRRAQTTETVIGVVILMVLAGIAAAVFIRQYRFNPAVTVAEQFRPPAVKAQAIAAALIDPGPPLAPLSAMETFDAATLSDKINGKAELYLSAGFQTLRSQRFRAGDLPDAWLEVFAYDMGGEYNAFSVYSMQRREDALSAGITPHSYQTPNALFFVQGPYYVEIIAAGASVPLQDAMKRAAGAFVKQRAPAGGGKIAELALFPRQDLVPETVRLIAANAFGFEGLDRVFTAQYQRGDRRLTAFLSRRADSEQARKLVRAYHDFLVTFGGRSLPSVSAGAGMNTVEIFDNFDVIFSRGPFLAGVHEAEDRRSAEALATRLALALEGEKR